MLKIAKSSVIANFTKSDSCVPKIKTVKSCKFVDSKPIGLENLLRLAVSLTVCEITPNLGFQGHVTQRVQKYAPFCSFSNGFRDNGQFTFPSSCDLEGSCDQKSIFSKVVVL